MFTRASSLFRAVQFVIFPLRIDDVFDKFVKRIVGRKSV